MDFDPVRDYPLGAKRRDLLLTPGGLTIDELDAHEDTLEAAELRATPTTLTLQSEVSRAAGRPQLADNLLRASELAAVPDETILEIYTALRPHRSTAGELEIWAGRLEEWQAPLTAAFVREAAQVYAQRGLLAR